MAGSDPTGDGGTLAGYADQEEIELLVRAGFSPVEAIHIATANGAEFLGQSARIGTIAQGKHADLVVIDGDPRRELRIFATWRSFFARALVTARRNCSARCAGLWACSKKRRPLLPAELSGTPIIASS